MNIFFWHDLHLAGFHQFFNWWFYWGEPWGGLKEKLPQAFMQIGWMEGYFWNPIAKVWANLDNPVKRYDFSKVSFILCMSPSQMALFQYLWCHNSTTVYWNCTHNVTKFHFSWKWIFPFLLCILLLRYFRPEMNVHAFMNELDQKDNRYGPRKFENCENLCTKSMESNVISHVLAEFHPERATYTNLHNHFS